MTDLREQIVEILNIVYEGGKQHNKSRSAAMGQSLVSHYVDLGEQADQIIALMRKEIRSQVETQYYGKLGKEPPK